MAVNVVVEARVEQNLRIESEEVPGYMLARPTPQTPHGLNVVMQASEAHQSIRGLPT